MARYLTQKATQCLRLLEAYDFAGMQAMCTGTATVWHSDGTGEQSIDEKLGQLKSLVTSVASLRYEVIRQFSGSDDVLQQQVLHLTMADGSDDQVHAAMYFRFEGGLIERIEEYTYRSTPLTTPLVDPGSVSG
ncbi:hypothetical protein [Mycolicibacterium lutetiense]